MKKRLLGLVTLVAVAGLALTACGAKKTDDTTTKTEDKTEDLADASLFPSEIKSDKEAMEGGTLKVALPHDSAIQGVWSWVLYEDAYDNVLFEIADQSIFNQDADFQFADGGMADIAFDVEGKKATITLQKDLKWSDGEPLTADDVIFPYEVLGHKDYTGVRYDERLQNIVGMTEYHDGTASTISGITKVDDLTVEINYKEMNPGMKSGTGVHGYAMPKHYLADVPVKDLIQSDKIRKNPVTCGPFKITNVKTGESVEYEANENYYLGRPKLDKITATVVPTSTIADELKAKKYDIALEMPSDTYDSYKSIDGYTNIGREELYYSYIGFKFGKYDSSIGEAVENKDAKMNNLNLRQAMAYAIDTDELGKKLYSGLRVAANSVIVPVFKKFHDADIEAYTKNIEKATELLDEAGYKDTDGDGYREDPNGNALTINLAAMDSGGSAETLTNYYIQSWKEIGLKVELTGGRLIEFNSFYDKVLGDEEGIDIYTAAWGVGTDPNPTESFGRSAMYNMMRYTSDDMDAVLAKINSSKSFDEEYRVEAFKEFQQLVHDQVPVIPLNYNNRIYTVNNRVTDYNISYNQASTSLVWFNAGVVSEDRE